MHFVATHRREDEDEEEEEVEEEEEEHKQVGAGLTASRPPSPGRGWMVNNS